MQKHPMESKHAHQQVRKHTGIVNLFRFTDFYNTCNSHVSAYFIMPC